MAHLRMPFLCGEGSEGKFCNFPYRFLFTPYLNDFLYTKVNISTFTSFTCTCERKLLPIFTQIVGMVEQLKMPTLRDQTLQDWLKDKLFRIP